MAYTLSIGENAPDFDLLGTDVDYYSLDSFQEYENLIILFTCNHCPYVKAVIKDIAEDCKNLENFGIKSVAICSNDASPL